MAPNVICNINTIREIVSEYKKQYKKIAFVPTMGNLHQGHLSLVEHAKSKAEIVIVSLFVNPMQFGPKEDFANYPRTLNEDLEKLKAINIEYVFVPEINEIYSKPLEVMTKIHVPWVSEQLCGSFRPGHFDGVATIVAKLFNIIQPDYAIFGKKDYQQLHLIKILVKDLNFPIEICSNETVREVDGLAMSSRNQYLTQNERVLAKEIYQTLQNMVFEINQSTFLTHKMLDDLTQNGIQYLRTFGFDVQYLEIRDAETLGAPSIETQHIVILIAAYLGKTRLIDNIEVHLKRALT